MKKDATLDKTFFEKSGKSTKLNILRQDQRRLERVLSDGSTNAAMVGFCLHHLEAVKKQIRELEGHTQPPW